jgi:hypothetical protein
MNEARSGWQCAGTTSRLADQPLDQVAAPLGRTIEIGVRGLVRPARADGNTALAAERVEASGGGVHLTGDDRRGLPARPSPPAGAQGSTLDFGDRSWSGASPGSRPEGRSMKDKGCYTLLAAKGCGSVIVDAALALAGLPH